MLGGDLIRIYEGNKEDTWLPLAEAVTGREMEPVLQAYWQYYLQRPMSTLRVAPLPTATL